MQSAHDVAQQLRWIRDGVLQSTRVVSPKSQTRIVGVTLGALLVAALAASGTYVLLQRSGAGVQQPTFRQMTFRRGEIFHPRFTPDGQTLVYSAAWDGKPSRVYSMRIDTAESVELPVP